MAAWLSSTSISHHNLLPHISSIHLSAVNSSPCPVIAQQSLNSSSQPLPPPGDQHSCPEYVWLWQGLSDSHSIKAATAVSLSALNVSPLTQTIALMWGSYPYFIPPPSEGRSSLTNNPTFPPSSFILLSFAWFYIFFCAGQVLLSALSWCSACTSVSEGVSLLYSWREMLSTSTYSSTILFTPPKHFFFLSFGQYK